MSAALNDSPILHLTCHRLSGLRWSPGVERGGKCLTGLLTRGRRGRMFCRAWGCRQPAHQVTHGRRRQLEASDCVAASATRALAAAATRALAAAKAVVAGVSYGLYMQLD
jgi:hypothetical protein